MNKNKSKKGFKTMFKNINLKKLNLEELRILLQSIDLYVESNSGIGGSKPFISEEKIQILKEYGDKICEEIQSQEWSFQQEL